MATLIQDFGQSDNKMKFSGSKDEDIAFAKTFWQSVHLQPPMESRLVSSNMKQRIKKAPPGHQKINITYSEDEEPKALTDFFEKAQEMQKRDEEDKIRRMTDFREADIQLLHKHRLQRIDKEKVSRIPGKKVELEDLEDEPDEDVAQETLEQLDAFDRSKGLTTCDSD